MTRPDAKAAALGDLLALGQGEQGAVQPAAVDPADTREMWREGIEHVVVNGGVALEAVEDPALVDVKPGLLRARVFAFGGIDDLKSARTAMHQLAKIDARIVAGFAQKGVHPLLVKEAKRILERSGVMPRVTVRGPMR